MDTSTDLLERGQDPVGRRGEWYPLGGQRIGWSGDRRSDGGEVPRELDLVVDGVAVACSWVGSIAS